MKKRDYPGLLPAALAALLLVANQAFGDSYELAKVKGMEAFNGSAGAKDLLGKNGFVVANPGFKQIFEAYIKSPPVERPSEKNPRGSVLPSFITTDSAWHTYHVLLEEGVKEIRHGRLLRGVALDAHELLGELDDLTGIHGVQHSTARFRVAHGHSPWA